MRLFTAINFGEETRAKLAALRDELKSASSRGNFTLTENLHLTLVFLGECDEKQAEDAKRALSSAFFAFFACFAVEINRLGRFKRPGGDLFWAGVRPNETLTLLYNRLYAELNRAGFAAESRPFSPHVTLGREVITEIMPRSVEPFGETVSSVDLMKSEKTVKGKLTYTKIFSVSLKPAQS